MKALEVELAEARALDEARLADAIESIGFECTRCGACCRAESPDDAPAGGGKEDGSAGDGSAREGSAGDGSAGDGSAGDGSAGDGSAGDGPGEDDGDPHTATVFPDEVRELVEAVGDAVDTAGDESGSAYDWRDVARPMPYGLEAGADRGETFEWALQTDECGDCTFYREGTGDDPGACTVHGDRPLICRTYPFSVSLAGTARPMGEPVDGEGLVRAHECEGLGRNIDRAAAEDLARSLKERAIRDLEEAIAVRDAYEPVDVDGVVVYDSEGAKRPDGTRLR